MAANNPFTSYAVSPVGSAQDAFAIAPSDSVAFTTAARQVYVGATGDVTLITIGGTTVLFKSVPTGAILPIVCTQVKATGTTATQLLGLV